MINFSPDELTETQNLSCSTGTTLGNVALQIKACILSRNSGEMAESQAYRTTDSSIHYEGAECLAFIVNELGRNQQIPALLNIHGGAQCMLEILKARYGIENRKHYSNLLTEHLKDEKETDSADKVLWRGWRADFAVTGVRQLGVLSSRR